MKLSTGLLIWVLVFLPGLAAGGTYCVYRTAEGKSALTNQSLPAGVTIIRCYDWHDSTDAEIAASEQQNRIVEARNSERDRTAAIERLTDEILKIAAQPLPAPQSQPIEIHISTGILTKPVLRKLRR